MHCKSHNHSQTPASYHIWYNLAFGGTTNPNEIKVSPTRYRPRILKLQTSKSIRIDGSTILTRAQAYTDKPTNVKKARKNDSEKTNINISSYNTVQWQNRKHSINQNWPLPPFYRHHITKASQEGMKKNTNKR